MLDWLKPILGDGYNEEIDNKIAAEINKGFVAKADYDAAKDAQRTAAEALARRQQGAGRVQGHRHRRPAQERRGMAGQGGAGRKGCGRPRWRRYSLMQSWFRYCCRAWAQRQGHPCSARSGRPARQRRPRQGHSRRTGRAAEGQRLYVRHRGNSAALCCRHGPHRHDHRQF